MDNNNYPDELLRGIPNKRECLDGEGRVRQSLFLFSEKPREDDRYFEVSINWRDDEGALPVLLNQRVKDKDDEFQFKAGVAVISKKELDILIKKPMSSGELSYERRRLPENHYHGNIICKTESKERQKLFRANLVMCVVEVIERQDSL